MYTPSQDTRAWSGETEEEAPITYVFSENENPWTVMDTGHLYRRLGEQGERLGDLDMTEFSLPSWMLLNALESLGYSVVEDLL